MESQVILLLLQDSATCSYPEADQSSPLSQSHIFQIHSYITIPRKHRGIIWGIISEYLWSEWGEKGKKEKSGNLVGISNEIRTGCFPSSSQEIYCLSQFVW